MKKKLIAEFLGTAFLLMIVVGSGIMGETLSNGNVAITLLCNSIATGAGLFVLIQNLGQLSGAHFNPVVSLVEMLWGKLNKKEALSYMFVQVLGAIAGVWLIHIVFNLPIIQISQKERVGTHMFVSEVVGTFGLIATIFLSGKKNVHLAPLSVALYITSAYWFTSSSTFANPAVTIARLFTNTFCGIAPNGVLTFLGAQLTGTFVAFALLKNLKE